MNAPRAEAMLSNPWILLLLLFVHVLVVATVAYAYFLMRARSRLAEKAGMLGLPERGVMPDEQREAAGQATPDKPAPHAEPVTPDEQRVAAGQGANSPDHVPDAPSDSLPACDAPALEGASGIAPPGDDPSRPLASAPAGQGVPRESNSFDRTRPAGPDNLNPFDRTAAAGADDLKTDKRKHRRCPYERELLVAPYDLANIPPESAFTEVLCNDVSLQGISFFLESAPTFRNLVVALISDDAVEKYMVCQVVRTGKVVRDGRHLVLVGCRFASRIPNEVYSVGLRAGQHGDRDARPQLVAAGMEPGGRS